jgi:hypothetical protein
MIQLTKSKQKQRKILLEKNYNIVQYACMVLIEFQIMSLRDLIKQQLNIYIKKKIIL